ncbi:hypothetical protein [Streptomyces sp. NPDC096132]|uniref:hypothetical protein n=1 Tax=Streptomyces sp. NPDC096132 TaxID=3366075 RepID=UPI00382338E4
MVAEGGGVLEGLGEGVAVEYVGGEGGGGDAFCGERADEVVELVAVAQDQDGVEAVGAEGFDRAAAPVYAAARSEVEERARAISP